VKDKTEKHATFRDYLHEVRARDKSTTIKEYTDRLLFQDKVREALEDLKDDGFSIQEGLVQVTPWRSKLRGFDRPDLVVSKEDVLFYLYLLISGSVADIERDFLRGLFEVIQDNVKVTAVVVIWNFDNLPSCVLDAFCLRKYIEEQEQTVTLEKENIGALTSVIRDFYDDQFVDWSIPEDLVIVEQGEEVALDLTRVLKEKLIQGLKKLEEKRFTVAEKKRAQKTVLEVDTDRILNKLLGFLSKPSLTKDDFDEMVSFLNRELRRVRAKDD
jgi:hypothetical protein